MPAKHTRESALALVDSTTDPDGCHLWRGSRHHRGYGQITFAQKQYGAHRLVWELHHGEIPEGMVIAHRCDNPPCCRLDHLFLTTQTGNQEDMCAKGRQRSPRGNQHWSQLHPERRLTGDRHHQRRHPEKWARGERCGCAKLTETAVREMRARHATGGISYAALGRAYGVSKVVARLAVIRKSWQHVP